MIAKSIRTLGTLAILVAVLLYNPVAAVEVSASKIRNLASACAMCHGTNGVSSGGVPSIAGQSREYLEMQLRDFRASRRPATIMQQIAKGYTDEEIGVLATYFSMQSSMPGTNQRSTGKAP